MVVPRATGVSGNDDYQRAYGRRESSLHGTDAIGSLPDQDDRVRMALGLTHDDPLPDVSEETLLAYHRYLAAHLKFPLHVTAWEKSGPFSSKKVTVAII